MVSELIILRCLGHVFRMPVNRISRRALFAQSREGWKRVRGGQNELAAKLKVITRELSCPPRRKYKGWDTVKLTKSRQGKWRGRSRSRAAFVNLHHLWRRRDISFSVKGRVYNAAVRSILLYGQKPGCCTPRTSKDFQCLIIDVFGALPEYGGNTGSAILK
ncbi:hypothetical protein T265_11207 [Opisthorchis viverrini]|uniref:Uncharacterized protein n=1 Tax=Opisthorchis viverrini TaxID=6198 RepID=A0A074YZW0_OPIVI|nr:hypothetical protein T265_11207 [Opisthorchis viverrini]KER20188.1 hypothetical protein T265_11207 [Opisthorchis viverrini]